MASARDETESSGTCGSAVSASRAPLAAIAGAVEQPTHPCPDCVSTQQGSAPEQQAANGAATTPKAIQASSAIATKRKKEAWDENMRCSLADYIAVTRDSRDCAA